MLPMWIMLMIQPLPGARIGLSSNLKCVLSLMAAAFTMMRMPLVARKTALQVISNSLKFKTKLIDLHEDIQFSILVLTCPEKDVSCIPHVCEQPHTISAAAAHSIHAALNTIFGPKYLNNRSSERFDMIRY